MAYYKLVRKRFSAMGLTKEIIEEYGFKRINNSMYRNGDMTLQSAYTHDGNDIYERILNTDKAYKACFKGKFVAIIKTEQILNHVVKSYCG